GEMRCRFQRRLAQDTRDCRVRALAGRAPCAISDGDIVWTEGLEPADRAPQRLLMAAVLGGKNSKDTSIAPRPRKRLLCSVDATITRRPPLWYQLSSSLPRQASGQAR